MQKVSKRVMHQLSQPGRHKNTCSQLGTRHLDSTWHSHSGRSPHACRFLGPQICTAGES